jgi:hypothetical protein
VLLLAAVGLIALLLVGPRLVDAYANWLWFEVLGPKSIERGSVELGRTAYEVVHLRLECGAVGVVPRVGRDVAPVDEEQLGIPGRLVWQVAERSTRTRKEDLPPDPPPSRI